MTEIKRIILDLIDQQEAKGLRTYGVTLDEAKDENYNWNVMALEELIDALSYQIKANMALKRENDHLKWRLGDGGQGKN